MGLGLTISKAIAEQHNGSLNLTNNEMGGELDVVARFPDVAVKISNFSDLERQLVA